MTGVSPGQLESLQNSLKQVIDNEQTEAQPEELEEGKKLDDSTEKEVKQLVDKMKKKGMSAEEIGKYVKDFLDQKGD